MKRFNRLFLISICLYFSFLSPSCSKREIAPPPHDPSDTLEPISQKLTACIYIDSTVSMEGFVVPGSSTNYAQILQHLEDSVFTGWPEAKVEFYKFGTEVLSIQRHEYLKSPQRSFYQNPQINRETHIQKVIDNTDTSGLTVIVTDLFQTDSDVTLLMVKLKEKYLQRNLAIGILGLRSQYHGTVYDVGINSDKFPHNSYENPERFRPFYVLILGKHADIARYFEQIKSSKLSFVSESNFIIFSRHIVNPLSSFEDSSVDSVDKLVEVANLVTSDVQDKRFKQFRIRGNPQSAEFTATLKYTSLPYTMSFKPSEMEADVIAEQYQGNKFVKNDDAKLSFIINRITLSGRGITIHAKLNVRSLPGDGIYRYEIILRPKVSSYHTPYWWEKWDMNGSQDGSKTLNLNRFLSSLWQTTALMHQPKIARFYCYIKK